MVGPGTSAVMVVVDLTVVVEEMIDVEVTSTLDVIMLVMVAPGGMMVILDVIVVDTVVVMVGVGAWMVVVVVAVEVDVLVLTTATMPPQ
jgi:hypothetical protein